MAVTSKVVPQESMDLAEIRRIILSGLSGYAARIYLFGSWVAGKAVRTSDVDVAILPIDPIPKHVLSKIREALEESRVICSVDLIDLSESSEHFRARVEREGILWSD